MHMVGGADACDVAYIRPQHARARRRRGLQMNRQSERRSHALMRACAKSWVAVAMPSGSVTGPPVASEVLADSTSEGQPGGASRQTRRRSARSTVQASLRRIDWPPPHPHGQGRASAAKRTDVANPLQTPLKNTPRLNAARRGKPPSASTFAYDRPPSASRRGATA